MTGNAAADRRPEPASISPRVQLLHILGLWGFSLAQPIYEILGKNPTFFVYRRWQGLDFLLFVLLLSLLLPLCLAAVGELVGLLGPPVRRWARAGLVFALAVLLALTVLVKLEDASPWLIASAAALAGMGVALARERFSIFRQFVSILALSVLIFPCLFLFRDGIRQQWLPSGTTWESSGPSRQTPVVFLVFDELPTSSLMDDRYQVDPIRYPSFARLAGTSTWFRRATTVDLYTAHSVPSILAGTCWRQLKAPILQEYPRNLFTLLADGHRFEAVERVTSLCPMELCADVRPPLRERFPPLLIDASIAYAHAVVPAGWRPGLPAVDNAWGDFAQDASDGSPDRRGQRVEEIAAFEASISRIDRTASPIFFFAHLVLPHRPFAYLPSGATYRMDRTEPGLADPWALRHSYNRHLLQLAYVDLLLGKVLARLDATGLFDDSLIVVTADHGVSFRQDQPARDISESGAIDVLSVPLFIKRPGQRLPEMRDDAAQTVDILPTIAEILGLPTPAWVDGRSLLSESSRATTASCAEIRGVPAPATTLAELFEAADAKTALFGTGASAGSFAAVGPRRDLLDSSAADHTCADTTDLMYEIDNPGLYEGVDPSSGFVPAEINGLIKGPGTEDGIDLALAVNGKVAATTRSYVSGAANVFKWSAIAPEDAFGEGSNRVEVFSIRSTETGCSLQPLRPFEGDWEPSFLNVRLGAWPVPLIEERGFVKSTTIHGTTRRKLRPLAALRIPLSPEDSTAVRRLKLELDVLDEAGATLRVRVNGRKRFDQHLEVGPWTHTLELEPHSGPEPLVITLRTAGATSSPSRRSAAAVHGIWLLPVESRDGGHG